MSVSKLQAPFPWFGGKSRAAHLVWPRFGYVPNYVEPFFGSGAVLLARPHPAGIETVNDIDGYIANFWRAVASEPHAVAEYASSPVNENDLHARHIWLVAQKKTLVDRLEGSPYFYDAKIAGWWVWGMACWIGGGFCSGVGPWTSVDGKRVHLGDAGQCVKRERPKLCHPPSIRGHNHFGVLAWLQSLAERLRRVRVCCGDWSRVTSPAVTFNHGLTGVFLDPPYSAMADRDMSIYSHDSGDVALEAREWALANGGNRLLRIALCGYEGEYTMPRSWECVSWKAHGGYAMLGHNQARENKHRERIWFSPHCRH